MTITDQIKKELKRIGDKEKAKVLARFFKTGKGEYGEGDKFLGIIMPKLRVVAKEYWPKISIPETIQLLQNSSYHEERMLALLILVYKYQKAEPKEKALIFKTYLRNTKFINNWDLVDVTCRDIIGHHLLNQDKKILYRLAKSKNIWERRIAIVATWYFISQNQLTETFKINKMLLSDQHDLIHKAVGWMLREAGKKDVSVLKNFLIENQKLLPRTTLRYAIERFSKKERQLLMKI
jgi:3-methyladenine DNA glycosylase AlkD